jgi:iron complex transport system ATP-binding protein
MTNIPLVELHEASVVKNGRTILDRVSLRIDEGQHTLIFGPNGCGKTSLLKLLTFTDYPLWSGNEIPPVRVLGQARWDVTELRKSLGIVSGDLTSKFLNDYGSAQLTATEAVITGYYASRELYDWTPVTDEMRQAAGTALSRMQIAALADSPIEWLSTGELRRVLIARALINRPRALVLDEPTSGLDVVAAAEFLATIQQLERQGVTLILVTHHLEELLPCIEQVILLKQGRVFRAGTSEECCTEEALSQLFGQNVAFSIHRKKKILRLPDKE